MPGPPKKPPRRNLSASPTHPDLGSENYELSLPHLGRNKSLDESVYADWQIAKTCFETSQSTDSIDRSSMKDHLNSNPCAKCDVTFLNGVAVTGDELNVMSKSQQLRLDNNGISNTHQDSVAHCMRDAKSKSEQNMSPSGQRLKENKGTKLTDAQENLSQIKQESCTVSFWLALHTFSLFLFSNSFLLVNY